MKQAIKEAALNNYKELYEGEPLTHEVPIDAFIKGAKWMKHRSYSEEEVKEAFNIGFNIGYGSSVSELDLKQEYCNNWFEQFKKK